jgi:hypothetical protein
LKFCRKNQYYIPLLPYTVVLLFFHFASIFFKRIEENDRPHFLHNGGKDQARTSLRSEASDRHGFLIGKTVS